MFLQEGFFHLFFKTYLLGGLSGALLFILAFNIFPVFQNSIAYTIALGSSASVLAILVAIATYVPNYSVHLVLIGRTKLKYIAISFVILDILTIRNGNEGGHIAHIGGALWGYIYSSALLKGNDIASFMNSLNFNWLKRFFTKKEKSPFKDIHRNKRPLTDQEYNARKSAQQKSIDKILDKISKSGYNSLTKEEKEILFKYSNKQ